MRAPFALALALATVTRRADASPLVHERIPDDPRDDIAMKVTLDGDLPAAIETPSGLVSAPDPRRGVDSPSKPPEPLASSPTGTGLSGVFIADNDTHRPGLLPYEEPFTPSTAPFKRLAAFDAVDSLYRLKVADPTPRPLLMGDAQRRGEELFFADLVVSPTPGHPFRIPSVGPGARVLHARLGSGERDIPFKLTQDGAANWFIEANEGGRLVMEESIPRAAFGGELGDPSVDRHPAKLPPNILVEANEVATRIGIEERTSPRDTLQRLVRYFRSFADSDERPTGRGSVYLDLALSKKGVCRHRAYAFTITALGLGIPARMIANEAHAWVEVNDGSLWRRIDLGGAGGGLDAARDASVVAYAPPPDPYPWPANAQSGEDLGRHEAADPSTASFGNGRNPSASPPANGSRTAATSPVPGLASALPPTPAVPGSAPSSDTQGQPIQQAGAEITLETLEPDVRRGASLRIRGEVRSEGEPCERVTVEVFLRDVGLGPRGLVVPLGALATDTKGKFAGMLVLPSSLRTADYDVVARTTGSSTCGAGESR